MIRNAFQKTVVFCLLGMAVAWVAATPAASAQDRDPRARRAQEDPAAPRRAARGVPERPGRMPAGESPRPAWDPVAMRYPEITWAALRFECGANDGEIAKIEPVYREARDQLETARSRAREERDPAGVAEATAKARSRIESEIAAALGEARKASLDEWLATCRTMTGRPAGDRRGDGPRRVDPFYLDRTWSYLTFDLKLDAGDLAALEPAYRSAWDKRKAAAKAADPEALAEAAANVRTSIETALKEALTSEQWAKMQEDAPGARRAGARPGAGPGQGRARGRDRME